MALPCASDERHVTAAEVSSFCAGCARFPGRMSTAASTSARSAPAAVCLSFCVPGCCEPVVVRVREVAYESGGLGFRLFPSAVWLAAFLASQPALLRPGRVLELGCGLGLCGLTAAVVGKRLHQGAPPLVTLTDFNPGLLHAAGTAAAANDVADTVSVAFCDWALEAGALSSADESVDGFSEDRNPEYFRVKRQQQSSTPWAHLPRGSSFNLVLATEVLYEMHAALTLPSVIAARLALGGRFLTLMAVRDTSILRAFTQRLAASPGIRLHVCAASHLPAPPSSTDQSSQCSVAAGVPLLRGARWMSGEECAAAIERGGEDGAALSAAWLEAFRESVADNETHRQEKGAHAPACCSRAEKGLACPCALKRRAAETERK